MSTEINFLIVGQGLAGSLLAWELIQKQQTVMIVDSGGTSASRVAAGLMNPVTGQRLVKTPGIDIYLPIARRTYHLLEQHFGRSFFFERPLLRLFQSVDELLVWKNRQAEVDYQAYLDERIAEGQAGYGLNNPLGGFRQNQCAYLDTGALLDSFKQIFQKQGILVQETLPINLIHPDRFPLQWQGLSIQHIIFCEGWRGMNNPWFSWLPFQPVKGDILTLQSDTRLPLDIISKKHWLIPLANGYYRFGASYQWSPLDEKIYDSTRKQLEDALGQLFDKSLTWKLIQQHSGIRPATRDRHPFLGIHPKYPVLSIMNGFGAKGCSLVPWYAKHLVNRLLKQPSVSSEGDISRYYSG